MKPPFELKTFMVLLPQALLLAELSGYVPSQRQASSFPFLWQIQALCKQMRNKAEEPHGAHTRSKHCHFQHHLQRSPLSPAGCCNSILLAMYMTQSHPAFSSPTCISLLKAKISIFDSAHSNDTALSHPLCLGDGTEVL